MCINVIFLHAYYIRMMMMLFSCCVVFRCWQQREPGGRGQWQCTSGHRWTGWLAGHSPQRQRRQWQQQQKAKENYARVHVATSPCWGSRPATIPHAANQRRFCESAPAGVGVVCVLCECVMCAYIVYVYTGDLILWVCSCWSRGNACVCVCECMNMLCAYVCVLVIQFCECL